MAREIKLNSPDWCDIVFEGRNKEYGAYALRNSSSKRHVVAFIVAIVLTAAIVAVPSLLKAVAPAKRVINGIDSYKVATIERPAENEQVVKPDLAPPPVRIRDSQGFTPPAIKPDDQVDAEKELISHDELSKSKAPISIATITNGNEDGVDYADVLKDNRRITDEMMEGASKVFVSVEVMPQFPGGDAELMKYLNTNIKYPAISAENGIEGRVVLRFVVGKDGRVSDIQVLKAVDPALDKEAIRVVGSMPKWIPGSQNGRHVAVYYTLPVLFRLK
jgi:protein TonB